MQQILALQKQLQEIQNKKPKLISQRILIQVILKLTQFNFVLYHTEDGFQYYYEQSLCNKLHEIIQNLGRLNVFQLAKLVNIESQIIFQFTSQLANNHKLIKVQNELYSFKYIDNVKRKLAKEIKIKGLLNILDSVKQASMPIQFFQSLINQEFKSQHNIKKLDLWLISSIYEKQLYCKLKGIMRAVMKPIKLNQLFKKYNILVQLGQQIVRQLIDKMDIKGFIKENLYVPESFREQRQKYIQKLFKSNGYLQYSGLKILSIDQPQKYLKQHLKQQCQYLKQCCMSKQKIRMNEQIIIQLLKFQGYVQMNDFLPPNLQQQEMQMIIQKYLTKIQNSILRNCILFDKEWMKKCKKAFNIKILFSIIFEEIKIKGKGSKKIQLNQNQCIDHLLNNKLLKYQNRNNIPQVQIYEEIKNYLVQTKQFFKKQFNKHSKIQLEGIIISKNQKLFFMELIPFFNKSKKQKFMLICLNILSQIQKLVKKQNQVLVLYIEKLISFFVYILKNQMVDKIIQISKRIFNSLFKLNAFKNRYQILKNYILQDISLLQRSNDLLIAIKSSMKQNQFNQNLQVVKIIINQEVQKMDQLDENNQKLFKQINQMKFIQ